MLIESSLNDLYASAVRAFPRTTKRQHAVDPIEVEDIRITPFMGMRTLLITGRAINENRQYRPLILFKNVQYSPEGYPGLMTVASEGRNYFFSPLSSHGTDVLVRCQCGDFHWRFQHFDKEDRSLYGADRKKYEAKIAPGSANPLELPGMCKHLMALARRLNQYGLVR